MKITFIGTAAADFSPLLKTEYHHRLGLDQRRSSSVLIDNRFLVDCGPHVLESLEIQGIDCSRITDLFLTHFHDDHCNWDNIRALAAQTAGPLRIWHRDGGTPEPVDNALFCPLAPGQEGAAGPMKVTALAANHTSFPLHYDFLLEGKRLFYGCDGGWLLTDTYNAMQRKNYDCMILDATVGDYVGDYRMGEHNSIPMIRLMLESFRTTQIVTPGSRIILSHIAPSLHKPHAETAPILEEEGLILAYDGMTVTI